MKGGGEEGGKGKLRIQEELSQAGVDGHELEWRPVTVTIHGTMGPVCDGGRSLAAVSVSTRNVTNTQSRRPQGS